MALTKCLECGHEVSTSAAACPNCGAPLKIAAPPPVAPPVAPPDPPLDKIETPPPEKRASGSRKWWFIGCGLLTLIAIVIGALLIGVIGGFSIIGSLMPDAKVENLDGTGDSRLINGDLDWGLIVSFDITSIRSEPKDIPLQVHLSCSEGEWTRTSTVHLGPNESRHLSFFFAEPTIGATEIKMRVHMGEE